MGESQYQMANGKCHEMGSERNVEVMAHPALELKPNPLYVKAMLFHIYVRVIVLELTSKREFDLADQLGRSARSVKNNINEAQAAQSRKDFINKLKLAAKELNEASGMIATEGSASLLLKQHQQLLLDIAYELARLIGKSVSTARSHIRD